MARDPIPTWYFAVVVVRRGDRFLLVHECKHDRAWYLPAGRVELGESIVAAACRETLEETGIPVRLTGVIRIEHSPTKTAARVRVIFLAEPTDDTPPKREADEESLEAVWASLDELGQYRLRAEDVKDLLAYVVAGGATVPVEILQPEGTPYLRTTD